MKQDLMKRLGRLEAVAGPEPIPPEIWFCADGWCHTWGGEPITRAALDGRPNTSSYERIFFVVDDEQQDVT
jgi:hypothetical protein